MIGDRTHVTEWAIGDTVCIDDEPTQCRVTAVQIRTNSHLFEVSWMNSGQPQTAWVEPWRLSSPVIEAVGFVGTKGEAK